MRLSRFLAPNPATRIPSGAAQVCWPRNKNRLVPSVWKSIFAQPPAADRPHFPRHARRTISSPSSIANTQPLTPTTTTALTALPPPFNLVTQMTSKEHAMHTCAHELPYRHDSQGGAFDTVSTTRSVLLPENDPCTQHALQGWRLPNCQTYTVGLEARNFILSRRLAVGLTPQEGRKKSQTPPLQRRRLRNFWVHRQIAEAVRVLYWTAS